MLSNNIFVFCDKLSNSAEELTHETLMLTIEVVAVQLAESGLYSLSRALEPDHYHTCSAYWGCGLAVQRLNILWRKASFVLVLRLCF